MAKFEKSEKDYYSEILGRGGTIFYEIKATPLTCSNFYEIVAEIDGIAKRLDDKSITNQERLRYHELRLELFGEEVLKEWNRKFTEWRNASSNPQNNRPN